MRWHSVRSGAYGAPEWLDVPTRQRAEDVAELRESEKYASYSDLRLRRLIHGDNARCWARVWGRGPSPTRAADAERQPAEHEFHVPRHGAVVAASK
jgi:hypothetical protein